MKMKFNGILTLFMAFLMQISFAQERPITGTVTDDSGSPLPGVNVIVKDTNNGTQTDFDGNYTITANKGATLTFSYIGFAKKEVVVGDSVTLNIKLAEDAAALEEVVIVGYGTATKKSFTGSAVAISAESLESKTFPNISQAITGETSGVTVLNTSGQPGNVSTVRIRGFGSVNGNRDPLYVVDGVPLTVPRLSNDDRGSDTATADFNNTISPLNSINPQDIESTTVLKDATATAIYGSRGANGVILITTKKGKTGESSIEVDVKTGVTIQLIPRYDVVTSPEEYIGYAWEGIYNRGIGSGQADPVAYANQRLFSNANINPGYNMWDATAAELIDPATRSVRPGVKRRYTPESFRDLSFRTGFRQEANLRISGGTAKTKYFASAGYLDDQGYAINTGFKRYNTRLNVTSDVKKWLKIGSNMTYSFSESQNNGQTVGSENIFEFADKNPPIYPVFLRDDDGNLVPEPEFGGFQYDYGSASALGRPRKSANLLNPIGSAMYDALGSNRHDYIGNFSAEIKLTEDLKFETKFGLQFSQDRQKDYTNPYYGSLASSNGILTQRDNIDITKNFLQLLRYNKNFGSHSVSFLAAHESNEYERQRTSASKREGAIAGVLELDNFITPVSPATGYSEGASLESYFSQLNYNYDNTYFLSASVRRDGSSRFINTKWGTFGSIGASWILSNEQFLANNNYISFMKLKTSYGVTGDQSGIDFYQGSSQYDIRNLGGLTALQVGNNVGFADITWETSKMFQVGIETSFSKYIDLDVDYYIKNTDNLFFNRRPGSSIGYASIRVNDGVLQNRGLEFNLTAHIIKTENASLDFTINGEHLNNEITTMPIEPSTGLERIVDTSPGLYAYSEGSSIFDFFLREWAGVDSATGVGLWNQYYDDANGNGTLDTGEELGVNLTQYTNQNPGANIQKQTTSTYSAATLKYVDKSSIPKLRGAFRLEGKYKNFSLGTQFTYSLGGWAYDAQYSELMNDRFGAGANNFHKDIAQRWQQPGDVTDVPRISDNFDPNVGSGSTRWLIRSDYLALNNVRLGYSIPSQSLKSSGISSVNIWISGDNLYVASKRQGFNPNTSETGNTGRRLYAPLSTINVGTRIKF